MSQRLEDALSEAAWRFDAIMQCLANNRDPSRAMAIAHCGLDAAKNACGLTSWIALEEAEAKLRELQEAAQAVVSTHDFGGLASYMDDDMDALAGLLPQSMQKPEDQ